MALHPVHLHQTFSHHASRHGAGLGDTALVDLEADDSDFLTEVGIRGL